MKNKIMIIGVGMLMVVGHSSLFAHGKDLHRKPSSEIRHEIQAELKNKTLAQTWGFVDDTIKDLAKGLQSNNKKKSKKELVRLKKALDILKNKTQELVVEETKKLEKPHHLNEHHKH